MFKRSVFITLILVSAAGNSVIAQEGDLLTPNTALDVMSGSVADVTSDGWQSRCKLAETARMLIICVSEIRRT